MRRALAILCLISAAASAQANDNWIHLAKLWIDAVPEPLLAACLNTLGAQGVVEARMNALGDLSLQMRTGGEPVEACVALVRSRLGTADVMGGISVDMKFFLPDAGVEPAQEPGAFEEFLWDQSRTGAFAKCECHRSCAVGELCERSTDGGMCIDIRALLRRRSPRTTQIGPANPPFVHFLSRKDPHCAGVGSKSDKVVMRVVTPTMKPLEGELTVIAFWPSKNGGIKLNDLIESIHIGKGRGFALDTSLAVIAQVPGCSSAEAVIGPEVSACVLFVVDCPAWLAGEPPVQPSPRPSPEGRGR